MKKITLALFVAGTLLALTSGANAADEMTEKMLESLTGQWCQISGTSIHGEYRKAKNYCREDRPVSFIVHNPGFWIKLRNVKTKIICIPQGVEPLVALEVTFENCNIVALVCRAANLRRAVSYKCASPLPE
jgi:hypothetical protein